MEAVAGAGAANRRGVMNVVAGVEGRGMMADTDLHGVNPIAVSRQEYRKLCHWHTREDVEFRDDRNTLRGGVRIGGYIYASTKNGPFRWEVQEQ